MAHTLKQINARIAKNVSPRVELVRGEGYHYFLLDDNCTDLPSIMVCYTSQQDINAWVEDARHFAAEIGL